MKITAAIMGLVIVAFAVSRTSSFAQAKKPNILIIWGDDIGYWNVSAYNQGMMGYKTPNIDPLAKEGRALHWLVRAAELHRRTGRVHYRPERFPHRVERLSAEAKGSSYIDRS